MDPEHFDPSDLREWRRMRAWHRKQLGWKQRQIAVALGVRERPLNRSDEALPPSAEAAGGHLNLIDPEQTTLPVVKVHTRSKLTFRSPLLAMPSLT